METRAVLIETFVMLKFTESKTPGNLAVQSTGDDFKKTLPSLMGISCLQVISY